MKRDWDLIRKMMLMLEECDDQTIELEAEDVDGYSVELVNYNILLLIEADLAKGSAIEVSGVPIQCGLRRLTYQGHELLDQIRPQTIWEKIKRYIDDSGADISLETIKITAPIVLRAMLGA